MVLDILRWRGYLEQRKETNKLAVMDGHNFFILGHKTSLKKRDNLVGHLTR